MTISLASPLGPRTAARAERQAAGPGAMEARGPASRGAATTFTADQPPAPSAISVDETVETARPVTRMSRPAADLATLRPGREDEGAPVARSPTRKDRAATTKAPAFRHAGPRPAALAPRLAAGPSAATSLAPASRAQTTAFATGWPPRASTAAGSAARVLTSRRTDQRHELRVSVVDAAARLDWPPSRTATLGTWPTDEAANDETARFAGPKP